jgi:inorganic pyrophosphatase
MNLLHDIDPGTQEEIISIIECPSGSKNKYEIDKETGLIALHRALHTAQDFPFEYGFIPQTLWDDGDALDVVILATYSTYPGIVVRIRPVALMNMIDSGEPDDKIIGVPVDDPRCDTIHDLKDINPHTVKEIAHFFETYKLKKDKVQVAGFKDAAAAKEAFERGKKLYQESKK